MNLPPDGNSTAPRSTKLTPSSKTSIPKRSSHPKGRGDLWRRAARHTGALAPKNLRSYGFRLRSHPEKGLGLFTNVDIRREGVVILEKPAMVWAPIGGELVRVKQSNPERSWDSIKGDFLHYELTKLPKPRQEEIMSLHNHKENSKDSELLSIFRTNSFGFSENENRSAIYMICSRFNHSCDPNCTWEIEKAGKDANKKDRSIRIIARRDIKAREELTIAYIPTVGWVEKRRDDLLINYGFKCDCSRCLLETGILERIYSWPLGGNQRATLRFRPRQHRYEPGGIQGWDFITRIECISGQDAKIDKGDIITQETPLILLTNEEVANLSGSLIAGRFRKLSSPNRNAYLRFYNWRFPSSAVSFPEVDSWPLFGEEPAGEEAPPANRHSTSEFALQMGDTISADALLDIWVANSFLLDNGMQGVFSFASHLDHSCLPTCKVDWRPGKKILNLVAIRPLEVGDDITICYNSSLVYKLPLLDRRQYLEMNYGFTCSCLRCCLESKGIAAFPSAPDVHPLPLSEILAAGRELMKTF